MSGLNKVMILGNLGRDPEIKDIKGIAVVNFSVATSKSWKDQSGEKQERTEWHNIVCYKKVAEIAGKYLSKGKQVFVEGELQTRSWDDKETGVKKYKTEIVAHNIQFIGDNRSKDENTSSNDQELAPTPSINSTDEIPF